MKRKIIYFLSALAVVMPTSAQKFFENAISLSDVSLWQQGNSLYVDMQIDVKNLTVSPERMLTLTPLLTDRQHNVTLEKIIIDGKRRQKAYLCGLAISRELSVGIVIPYNKREVLNYAQVVPYEPQMANASLNLVKNLCGCGNNEEMLAQELITNDVSTEVKRLSTMVPMVVYIQPTVEAVKNRSEQYEAHFDFPVSKAVVQPEFMNNYKEPMNIHAMSNKTQNGKNLTVTGINIEGFVSSEGPLKFNGQLSQKRAEALKSYLTTNEKVPDKLYEVTFGGENWDGLVQALEKSSMEDKDKFISIIKNTTDDARRKQEIMHADGGAPCRTMLKEICPGLRKVNCKIGYTVANFDIEQGRVVIKVNPKCLSLNEIYQVANSYPKGSSDFVNVFDIAIRMYPNDEVTNLNAAAVSLTEKGLENTIKYMDKANHQTAGFINDAGVYNFLDRGVQRAVATFNQVVQIGNEATKANLQRLQQVLNMKKK